MGNTPAPSANLIVVGFIASALGGALTVVGTMVNAAEVVSQYVKATNPGTGWVVFGLCIAGAGLFALAAGFYNLASGVDYLVQSTKAPAGAPVDAPADTV